MPYTKLPYNCVALGIVVPVELSTMLIRIWEGHYHNYNHVERLKLMNLLLTSAILRSISRGNPKDTNNALFRNLGL